MWDFRIGRTHASTKLSVGAWSLEMVKTRGILVGVAPGWLSGESDGLEIPSGNSGTDTTAVGLHALVGSNPTPGA